MGQLGVDRIGTRQVFKSIGECLLSLSWNIKSSGLREFTLAVHSHSTPLDKRESTVDEK